MEQACVDAEKAARKLFDSNISHEAPVTGGFGAEIFASIVERSFLRASHFNPFSRYILMEIKKGTFKNRSTIN
ncbi:putative 3-methyl-2-oxobutanoate dehydrogenase (2-methylpropanoyl-transferring) [Helianthus anomalus]